jgi:hypothetical protein
MHWRRWPAAAPGSGIRLHGSLQAIYADRPAIAAAFSLHELAWLLGALETWIALRLMGMPVNAAAALILESLSQALRAAAFPVPSGLGIQEGGFIALGALFGIPPEAALALSFVKRVPDLAIGLPGFVAWYWLEFQRLPPIAAAVPPRGLHGLRAALAKKPPTRDNTLPNKRMIKMNDVSVIYERSALSPALISSAACPVNSWNEWDLLEEVIVGRLDGAVVPPFHVSVTYNRPHSASWLHRLTAGRRYPRWMARRAQTELDGFIRLLEAEGVRVRRPGADRPAAARSHAPLVISGLLPGLPSRCLPGRRRRDYRNADMLAFAPLRGRRLSEIVQRVFRRWRALDRCAAATAARRVV